MTDNRGQFTFYASIYASASRIRNKAARADFYDAICAYALNGTEPDLDKLSDAGAVGFLSAKPNLDASRRKAKSGKAGGSTKQTGSKPEANGKQSASEKEVEKEVEKENEIEVENDKRSKPEAAPVQNSGKSFTAFWESYPSKIGREAAWDAWKALNPDAKTVAGILSGLDAWKVSEQWTDEGGRYIPRAAKFLSERHWESPPKECVKKGAVPYGASGKLGAAELEAIHRILTEPDYGLRKPGEVVSE